MPMPGLYQSAPYSNARTNVVTFLRTVASQIGGIQAFVASPDAPGQNAYIGVDPGGYHWEYPSFTPQPWPPHNHTSVPLEFRSWQELGALLDACAELGFHYP